jgi:carbon-monoxide dehydrogenase small subunit
MDIVTVEGLAPEPETLSILQDCFWETHALQCGFCTPGMLIAARALLAENPSPSAEQIREGIGGNLCRCTGYKPIVDAILLAAERMRGSNVGASDAHAD